MNALETDSATNPLDTGYDWEQAMIAFLQDGIEPEAPEQRRQTVELADIQEYEAENGILYRKMRNSPSSPEYRVPFIATPNRQHFLETRARGWWPQMAKDPKDFATSCRECQLAQRPRSRVERETPQYMISRDIRPLYPTEPCMHFRPFLRPLSWGQPVPRSSSSIHAYQRPRAISGLVLSLLLLGSVCMNTLRLLSLKMTAAIPGSNPSFSVNRVCIQLSHQTQPLQARAVQLSVIDSYQKVCSPLPDRIDRSCRSWHQRGRSASTGVSAIQSSPIFST
jgi:hypothetical protein